MKSETEIVLSRYKSLADFVKTELTDYIEEIVNHGCSGGFPYLTYYSDTGEIYAKFKDEIWDILQEMADNQGENNVLALIAGFNGSSMVSSPATFENLLVWATVEHLAYLEMGRRGTQD